MKRSSALAGVLGLVLLIFGLIGYFFTGGNFAKLYIFVNIFCGLLAIIGWIVASRGSFGALMGKRATRYGANAVAYSLAFIGLLVAINYLGITYNTKFDMTAEKVFSLSPQSLNIVKGLKHPLKIYGFVQNGHSPVAQSLYQEYAYASPQVSYRLIDPVHDPELADRYKVSVNNTTHIQYGKQGTNVTDLSEQAITNGILKVIKSANRTVYFVYGEGEGDPSDSRTANGLSQFQSALEGENYKVERILLASQPRIPEDCNVLVIAGPTRPLQPHEIDAINDYLERGGRLLVMMRPPRPDRPFDESALTKLVAEWGVDAGHNVVVDQEVRLFAGPALGLDPMVSHYGAHPITASFDQQTVFPMTRSISPIDPPKPGLIVTPLAKTGDSSWAETNLTNIFEKQVAAFTKSDTRGPITVAAAVTANLQQLGKGHGEARLVVFGDTQFANNHYINVFFNRDFIMNSVDWLAGEANAITIRPRTLRASRFDLTIGEFDVVFVLSVLLLPELLLIIGIAVWWDRRN
ncbi:MAG: GldG family protein [Candidatus Binataceae bacterium]